MQTAGPSAGSSCFILLRPPPSPDSSPGPGYVMMPGSPTAVTLPGDLSSQHSRNCPTPKDTINPPASRILGRDLESPCRAVTISEDAGWAPHLPSVKTPAGFHTSPGSASSAERQGCTSSVVSSAPGAGGQLGGVYTAQMHLLGGQVGTW